MAYTSDHTVYVPSNVNYTIICYCILSTIYFLGTQNVSILGLDAGAHFGVICCV